MNNRKTENPGLASAAETGMFRFGLIAPVIQGTYPDASAAAYCRRVTAEPLVLPDGTAASYSPKTLEKWISDYRRKGFDGLMPSQRSDKGTTRALSDAAVERIYSLKMQFPRMNATQAHRKLIEEGYLTHAVSVSTVQRFFRNNDITGAAPQIKDRKAFEEAAFGDMWQADTKYMPRITECGESRRVYCISVIDDHSRMIVGGGLFYSDSAANFQKVLKDAVSAYGIPRKLYVDNGAPYANEQLSLICGELGTELIHAKPRDGAAKAKIERYWRTLDERFNFITDLSGVQGLQEYNDMYRRYVRDYNTRVHGGTGEAPFDRYRNTCGGIRVPESGEWLSRCFLNRVERKVRLDATVTIGGGLYDAPMEFIRQKVEIRYIPSDMSTAFILHDGRKYPLRRTDKNENARTKRRSPQAIDYTRIGGVQ